MKKYSFLLFLIHFAICTLFAQQNTLSYPIEKQGGLNLGAYAGPSLLIEKAPDSLAPEIQNFYNQLRSGWHYGLQAEYFFNTYFGIGARYSRFNTKKEADSIVLQIFSQKYYIDISSNMSIHSVSPMVYGRYPFFENKLTVNGGIGMAWIFFRNLGKAVDEESNVKGSLPGLSSNLGINYQVSSNLSATIQGNYIRAFLKEFTQDNGSSKEVIKLEKKDYQNISRIDLSFGLSYTFK